MKVKQKWVCERCKQTTNDYPNNGVPLINGKVCDDCNRAVIEYRLLQFFKK